MSLLFVTLADIPKGSFGEGECVISAYGLEVMVQDLAAIDWHLVELVSGKREQIEFELT